MAEGQQHGPFVLVSDFSKELRQRVRRKTDSLKNDRLPRAQKCLANIEGVSTELSLRAENVRSEIRSSGKRVSNTIELLVQQGLVEVDNLEEERLKHLNSQHDELKQYTGSLNSAVRSGENVLETDNDTENVHDLLLAIDKRMDELEKVQVVEDPVEHARMAFESVDEDELLMKSRELVGLLLADPCQASAAHSVVEGDEQKTIVEDSSVTFVVVAKDYKDRPLSKGGDSIRVEWQETPEGVSSQPSFEVIDNNDGTYQVTCTPPEPGDYSFDVFINDVKMKQRLSISCRQPQPPPFTFDPNECQQGNKISQDKLTVTHTGADRYSSVLGSVGMETGVHVWKVKISSSPNVQIFLGVAEKPGITADTSDYNYESTYSWFGGEGTKYILGHSRKGMNPWTEGDILQLELDCDKHILSIINTRSGEQDSIQDLPNVKLFAYFYSYFQGESLILV